MVVNIVYCDWLLLSFTKTIQNQIHTQTKQTKTKLIISATFFTRNHVQNQIKPIGSTCISRAWHSLQVYRRLVPVTGLRFELPKVRCTKWIVWFLISCYWWDVVVAIFVLRKSLNSSIRQTEIDHFIISRRRVPERIHVFSNVVNLLDGWDQSIFWSKAKVTAVHPGYWCWPSNS